MFARTALPSILSAYRVGLSGASGKMPSTAEQSVNRAPDCGGAAVQDVGVGLGRADVAVHEQFLDRPDVAAILQQVCRERMAKGVGRGALGHTRAADRLLHDTLEHGFVEVVPAKVPGGPVSIQPRGGEDPLPHPLASGVRVLSGQRGRSSTQPAPLWRSR